MNEVFGIRACSDRYLHDIWHKCCRVGADKTADAIAREMSRRHITGTYCFGPMGADTATVIIKIGPDSWPSGPIAA